MRKPVMSRIKNHRPSAALVVALIALFVALGGTSYAALKLPKNSVGSAQVINGSLQKADLAKKTVSALKGNVGPQGAQGSQGSQGSQGAQGAQGAQGTKGDTGAQGPAGPSTGAAGGALSGSYPNPGLAVGAVDTPAFAPTAKAPDADKLDGHDSTDFVAAPASGWHFVGQAGEPPFLTANQATGAPDPDGICLGGPNAWANYGNGYTRAAFFRDSFGIVHLSGMIMGGQYRCAVFQLPAGYRPEERALFSVAVNPDVFGRVDVVQSGVGSAGSVVPRTATGNNTYLALNGISFRCGPAGQNGCP